MLVDAPLNVTSSKSLLCMLQKIASQTENGADVVAAFHAIARHADVNANKTNSEINQTFFGYSYLA